MYVSKLEYMYVYVGYNCSSFGMLPKRLGECETDVGHVSHKWICSSRDRCQN